MTGSEDRIHKFDELRHKAEELIAQISGKTAQPSSGMLVLVEELRLHQAELVLQNQQLQESQEELAALHREYADLYDEAPTAYVTISAKGIVKRFNRAAGDMFDLGSELAAHTAVSRLIAPQSEPDYRTALQAAAESGETEYCELKVRCDAPGTGKWISAAVRARLDDSGHFDSWRLAGIDISSRVALEDKLTGLIREKDLLMRELTHRVKNNLSLVASLIRIKESEIGNETDLTDLENRVMSIASVYEQLQISDLPTEVPFPAYVRRLLSSVFGAETGESVNIVTDKTETMVDPELAIKLGLIVSELATNAVKHGFDTSAPAEFSVQIALDQERQEYTLRVSNSGRPFPPDVDLERTSSFGIQFVRVILDELDARITLVRTPQTLFTITFPVPERVG